MGTKSIGSVKDYNKKKEAVTMATIRTEQNIPNMKKWLLKSTTNFFPVLPRMWTSTSIGYSDLAGNNFVCPVEGVDLEDGSHLSLILYSDELALFDETGRLGAWNVVDGEICW